MYAVIETGGKQYKVATGDVIKVEKLDDVEDRQVIDMKKVLMCFVDNKLAVGKPHLQNAVVKAEVTTSLARHKKVKIIKFKRRKHHMKQQGHRQSYTELTIKSIELS
jgi:large subunit ribosomal protein L21